MRRRTSRVAGVQSVRRASCRPMRTVRRSQPHKKSHVGSPKVLLPKRVMAPPHPRPTRRHGQKQKAGTFRATKQGNADGPRLPIDRPFLVPCRSECFIAPAVPTVTAAGSRRSAQSHAKLGRTKGRRWEIQLKEAARWALISSSNTPDPALDKTDIRKSKYCRLTRSYRKGHESHGSPLGYFEIPC